MVIEKLYTVEEVAALASVTGRTIRNYLKSGRLVGRKIGGQWRFPESEVQRLLSGGEPLESPAPAAQAIQTAPAESMGAVGTPVAAAPMAAAPMAAAEPCAAPKALDQTGGYATQPAPQPQAQPGSYYPPQAQAPQAGFVAPQPTYLPEPPAPQAYAFAQPAPIPQAYQQPAAPVPVAAATPTIPPPVMAPASMPAAAPVQRPPVAEDSFSEVGLRVTRFISEVHNCSEGPCMCAMVDLQQALPAAKATSEQLARIAAEESTPMVVCQSFVEYDDRYSIARYTLLGSTVFLSRCLNLIG